MVEVVPFKGHLYNFQKAGSPEEVVAPPYDVISPKQQEDLYAKNPYNIVRLILNRENEADTDNNNRYTRSAETFRQWIEDRILVQDENPAFYVYSQEYSYQGETRKRTGFFARVRVEDFDKGNICPHEYTLAKAKTDRMRLLTACQANFSPIFGLYSDPEGTIDRVLMDAIKNPPLMEINDNGIVNTLWRLDDETRHGWISETFLNKKIFIADGHHRYETALAYHRENGHQVKDSAHVMMFLTNLDAQSLAIYPIHRLIKSPEPFDKKKFLDQIGEYFEIRPWDGAPTPETIKSTLENLGKDRIAFGVYLGKQECHIMELRDTHSIVSLLDPDESTDLRVLDVAQLHTLVIRSILKVNTKRPESQQFVTYKVDAKEAMERVDSREFDLAFFMNPTRIDQVRSLAEKGIRLPQKATFFYPKLLSGLVINKFGP